MVVHTALKGHSGALLSIEANGGHYFVRKQAADPARSNRLRAQAAKQDAAFRAGIPCPRVLGSGESQGCFHFDMEYLPSISVAQAQIDSMPLDRKVLFDFIEMNLGQLAETAQGTIPEMQFLAKINQIDERCQASNVLSDLLPAISRVISTLRHYDWSGIPASTCHGDFTLENILYSKERGFFIIDFDDVDLSSFYLDAAKLFQDLWGHWCLRDLAVGESRRVALLNAMISLDGLRVGLLKRLSARWPGLPERMRQMVILHLVRVLPYCERESTAVFVLMRINQMLADANLDRGDIE